MSHYVILDERIPKGMINALSHHGYQTILLPPHPCLPCPIASHPDMLLFFASDAIYTTKLYSRIAEDALKLISSATRRPIRICQEELSKGYEKEPLLNTVPIGNKLICHSKLTAREIIEQVYYELCPTRQGYAKCSVVPIDDHSLITADVSISKAARQQGIDVLLLQSQGCFLEGYDTGFIGGATSYSPYQKIEPLFFCGDINRHPQSKQIIDFCQRHHREPISLDNSPLLDMGTVFII